ncbi:unnamed protein product, partial [Gulo gulo]
DHLRRAEKSERTSLAVLRCLLSLQKALVCSAYPHGHGQAPGIWRSQACWQFWLLEVLLYCLLFGKETVTKRRSGIGRKDDFLGRKNEGVVMWCPGLWRQTHTQCPSRLCR